MDGENEERRTERPVRMRTKVGGEVGSAEAGWQGGKGGRVAGKTGFPEGETGLNPLTPSPGGSTAPRYNPGLYAHHLGGNVRGTDC